MAPVRPGGGHYCHTPGAGHCPVVSDKEGFTMRILVDQDGVLADFDAGWERDFTARWGLLAPVVGQLASRRSFKVDDQYPPSWRDAVREISTRPGFFESLPPVPGAIAGLHALAAAGHDVYIATAPLSTHRHCVAEKYAWVEKHLGHQWTKRVIMTKDKTLVRGDVLIDDKPHVTGSMVPAWVHVRYTRSYNADLEGVVRLTWADAAAVIAALAADLAVAPA